MRSNGGSEASILTGINRALHVERSLAEDGSWVTSVSAIPSQPGIRELSEHAGSPTRTAKVTSEASTMSRLVFNEGTGGLTAHDVHGAPIALEGARGGRSPQQALGEMPRGAGSFLTQLVTDSSQAAAKREALRALFGEKPAVGTEGEKYRRPVPRGELELILDARTGLVKEETMRRAGAVVSRTAHTYRAVGDGRHVRIRTQVSHRSRSGAMRGYDITFSNVLVDGVVLVGGGKS